VTGTFNKKGPRRLAFLLIVGGFTSLAIAVRRWSTATVEPAALLAMLGEARAADWLMPSYLASFGLTTFLAPAFPFFAVAGALWGFWPGLLMGWSAALLWSNLHFAAGRLLGRVWVRQWLTRRGFDSLRDELETGGVLATLIARQVPLPFVGVNLAAGASPMRWWRFGVGNALGLLPGATIYSWSAASIVAGVEGARREAVVRTILAAGAVIGLGALSRLLQRRLQRGRAA
jgi:uncharacterized membrane protein YdjX (TVP38/TMEM64 family)